MQHLAALSQARGVSGDEAEVRDLIIRAIQDHVSELHVDTLGNITAIKRGTSSHPVRVMVDAHMDEVGFMVMGFENDGLLRFAPVGSIDDRLLPALRVHVGKKAHKGVILWTPIHQNRDQTVKSYKDLRIDIGASSKQAAEGMVSIGERITFDSAFVDLGRIVRGKAFDDRVGCALLIDLLQGEAVACDILASFTVQEEIGLRGAKVSARRLRPDCAIALEGTTAHDVPSGTANPDDLTTPNQGCALGGGAALTVMDRSMVAHPRLLGFIRETATTHGIPYQFKTVLGGGTNAGAIHLTEAGVPSAVISVPCRYIHSPAAMLHRDDYANTLQLLRAVLNNLTSDVFAS